MKRVPAMIMGGIVVFYLVNAILAHHGLVNFAMNGSELSERRLEEAYECLGCPTLGGILNFCGGGVYPPGYLLGSSLILHVLGKDWLLMNLAHNTFYLSLLLVFIFLLGKEIKDEKAGLLSCLLVSLYPLIYGSYSLFSTEFASTSILVMSIYFLYRSRFFRHTGWSMLCALSCGWGMMTKDPFAAFFAGPALYGAGTAVRQAFKRGPKPLLNLFLFAMILGIVISPYYLNRAAFVIHGLSHEPSGVPWNSFANVRFFTIGLWEHQLTPPLFLVLCAGAFCFVRAAEPETKFILFSWILIPNLILFFMPHWKTPRDLLPQLPALAIISSFGLRRALAKGYGRLLLGAVVLIGTWQYYAITYGVGLAWLDSYPPLGYFRQFNGLTDTNPTRGQLKEHGEVMRGLGDALRKGLSGVLPRKAHPGPYRVVMLDNRDGEFHFQMYETYLWFGDSNITSKMRDIFADPSVMRGLAQEIGSFDFLLYPNKEGDGEFGDERYLDVFRQEYEFVKKRQGANPQRSVRSNDWELYRAAWNSLRPRLKPLGVIHRRGEFRYLLYKVV